MQYPAGLSNGVNVYAYVGGNPIMMVDPSGLGGEGVIEQFQDYFGGIEDMVDNFNDMKDSNVIGADKYFHCKGNCEAASRGRS